MNEDKATRYQRQRRLVSVASVVWGAFLSVIFVASGASVATRRAAEMVVGGARSSAHAGSTVALFVVVLVFLHEIAMLPFAWYSGFAIERRYGLSKQRLGGWLLDEAKNEFYGRPTYVLPMPEGSLLVSDEHNGATYRISYSAPVAAAQKGKKK